MSYIGYYAEDSNLEGLGCEISGGSQSKKNMEWFVEASIKLSREQLLFLHKAMNSKIETVSAVASTPCVWRSVTDKVLKMGLCLFSYSETVLLTYWS